MKARMSKNIALFHPEAARAVEFYKSVLCMKEHPYEGADTFAELHAGPICIFVGQGPASGPVMEFVVPDVEAARVELEQKGCEVVRWEGAGRDCYMRDPFGLTFNLWQDPAEFERGEYDCDETVPADGDDEDADRGEYVP